MKLIANLDIPAKMADVDFIVKAGQEVEFEYIEDLGYESEEISYLAADPIIDGLLLFRHPNAPWGASANAVAKDLYEKWLYLLEEFLEEYSTVPPNERMIGTVFLVCCWKAFDRLQVGEVCEAVIENSFGLDTNGFVIYHDDREIVVETINEVINHFVLV